MSERLFFPQDPKIPGLGPEAIDERGSFCLLRFLNAVDRREFDNPTLISILDDLSGNSKHTEPRAEVWSNECDTCSGYGQVKRDDHGSWSTRRIGAPWRLSIFSGHSLEEYCLKTDQFLHATYDHLISLAQPAASTPESPICWQIYTRWYFDKTRREEVSRYVMGDFGDGRSIKLEKYSPEDSKVWELTSVVPATDGSLDSKVTNTTHIAYYKGSKKPFVRKIRKDPNGSILSDKNGDVRDVGIFLALAEEAQRVLPGRQQEFMRLGREVAPPTIEKARLTPGLLRRLVESLAPISGPEPE